MNFKLINLILFLSSNITIKNRIQKFDENKPSKKIRQWKKTHTREVELAGRIELETTSCGKERSGKGRNRIGG